MPPAHEIVFPVAEPAKVFLRQIDPAALRVVPDIAQDIRQLKRNAQVDGIVFGVRRAGSEDVQADESDHRGHAIAILVEVLERGVAPVDEIHLDAVDEILEVDLRDAELFDVPGQARRDGAGGLSPIAGGQFLAPAGQFRRRIAARRRLIDDAVHLFAKGIDRIHGFPTVSRQEQKRIVEVAAAALRDVGAVGLGFVGRHSFTGAGEIPLLIAPKATGMASSGERGQPRVG